MKEWLEQKVMRIIADSGLEYYREPLFGYTSASDLIFLQFKTAVGEDHLLPFDLLPGAKSVFDFFPPFRKEIIEHNRGGRLASCFHDTIGCSYCQKICPVQALTNSVFNRQDCYKQLLLNDQTYQDLELCDVCGKCATGPCSYIE